MTGSGRHAGPQLPRLLGWVAAAQARLAAGDTAGAASLCQRILKVDATQPEALMMAGALCVAQACAEQAEALLERGAAAHPSRLEFHLALSRLRLQMDRRADAVEPLEHCVLLQPENPEHRATLAGLYQARLFASFSLRSKRALIACLHDDTLRHDLLNKIWLSLLRLDPEQQDLLRWFESPTYEDFAGVNVADKLLALQNNELLLTGLRRFLAADLLLERGLIFTRRWFRDHIAQAEALLPLLCRLACYCYLSEFVFACEAEDTALPERPTSAAQAALLGCYEPLHRSPFALQLAELSGDPSFHELLRVQVLEPLQEQTLLPTISRLTPIEDEVSQAVRTQYEESPYPRWRSVGQSGLVDPASGAGKRVLVAGCGTGREALELALLLPAAQVLGLDLSRSSLAYAARKALELGAANLCLQQADLLKLEQLPETFDLISCVGVLHHLQQPVRGLQQLVRRLQPRGVMVIGLYSTVARRPLELARQWIAQERIGPTPAEIRGFRARVAALSDSDPIKQRLAVSYDFYSLSSCRDLLFHVQEHTFSLLQVADLLRECGLSLLMVGVKSPAHALAYRQRFPDDLAATNLQNWHVLEQEHPTMFGGLYALWLYRRGEAPDIDWLRCAAGATGRPASQVVEV
ncbi:MAG TPA: methyltransferase domain-containing protein [Polyangiaceae bacterium]|nr:methyltransferase domain-containing protein [Polyangiaceae bacterium]